MGNIKNEANSVYADGPSGAPTEPQKSEIRSLFGTVEDAIEAASVGYDVSYETRAELYADLDWPADSLGRVFGDANSAYIGVYKKSGASGAGSWAKIGELPGGDTAAIQDQLDDVDDRVDVLEPLVAGKLDNTIGTKKLLGRNTAGTGPVEQLSTADALTLLALEKINVKGADIASAATINLDTATGDYPTVTGNTGISAVTLASGVERLVLFSGTPLITTGALLKGDGGDGVPVQIEAGDWVWFKGEPGGAVRFRTLRALPVVSAVVSESDDILFLDAVRRVFARMAPDGDFEGRGWSLLDDGNGSMRIMDEMRRVVFEADADGLRLAGFTVVDGSGAWVAPGTTSEQTAASEMLMGPELFSVSTGNLVIQPRNIFPERSDGEQAIVTLSIDGDAPDGEFVQTSTRGGTIAASASAFGGTTGELTARMADSENRLVLPLAIHRKAVPVAGTPTPKILAIGDSITNRQTLYFADLFLAQFGVNADWIGTIPSSDDPLITTDADGPLGEGREGWSLGDYFGTDTDGDVASILAPGDEATYLATVKSARDNINPFLRAATGGDDPSIVFPSALDAVDRVVDFEFYRTRWAVDLAVPDIITLNLAMNDMLEIPDAEDMMAQVSLYYPLMIDRIRAAFPSAEILCWLTALPRNSTADDRWLRYRQIVEFVIKDVYARRDDGDTAIHFVNVHAAQSQESGWLLNAGTTNDWGVITTTIDDETHPIKANRTMQARMLADAIVNLI